MEIDPPSAILLGMYGVAVAVVVGGGVAFGFRIDSISAAGGLLIAAAALTGFSGTGITTEAWGSLAAPAHPMWRYYARGAAIQIGACVFASIFFIVCRAFSNGFVAVVAGGFGLTFGGVVSTVLVRWLQDNGKFP